jgi:hypothetical protein
MKSKICFLRSINFLFFLATIIVIGSSCKKELDINQDPNNPSVQSGTVDLIFPTGVLATVGKVGGDLTILGGIWSEYYTQSVVAGQYKTYDSYDVKNTDAIVNAPYDILFSDGLKNYKYVIDNSRAQQNWNFYLMATVMNVYTTGIMVDLYDKMPYSQALQGTANLDPKFDDGYTIYESLLSSLDSALNKDLTTSQGVVPNKVSDLIFGGNMDKWEQFGNTLKLKLYLRMVNAKPAEAQTGITALFATATATTFLSTDASVTNFTDQPNKDNPFYEQNVRSLNTPDNLRASTTFVSWLVQYNDPRASTYFGSNNPTPTVDQGNSNGSSTVYGTAPVFVQSPTDPVIFISAAESAFLQSEADLRYLGAGHAQALYDSGVSRSFAATGNDASPFIGTGPGHAYDSLYTLAPLEAIITQKWASFPVGCHAIEGFFERNRTGFPRSSSVYSTDPSYIPGQFVLSPNSVLSPGLYPKRLVYPYDETSKNSNAPALVPITTPVWWGL